jgi:hypothetical protein
MRRRTHNPSVWILALLIALCSLCGGILAQGQASVAVETLAQAASIGTVDVVTKELQLPQETYLARCTTCHVGIPPAVLPTESWKAILEDDNHYGVPWTPLRNPELALLWRYTRTFSRPLNPDEGIPYRVGRSRYFRILHPKVKFSAPVTVGTCVSCHPGVSSFNFRDLSPQWQDAP